MILATTVTKWKLYARDLTTNVNHKMLDFIVTFIYIWAIKEIPLILFV